MAIPAALQNLQTELLSRSTAIVNDAALLADCQQDISDYIAVRAAVSAMGLGVTSYSIQGRSVSRRSLGELRTRQRELEGRLQGWGVLDPPCNVYQLSQRNSLP